LGFDARNRVYRWDPVLKNIELYPDDFEVFDVGCGYKMWLDAPVDVSYWAAPGTNEVEIPAPGITWVGIPSVTDIFQGDVIIYNPTLNEYRTIAQDAEDHPGDQWLNSNWVFWNSSLRTAEICVYDGSGDDTTVHPWRQYQVWSNIGGLKLIFQ